MLIFLEGPIQRTYSTVFDPITLPESPFEYDYTWNLTVYITNDWGARAVYELPATVGVLVCCVMILIPSWDYAKQC